MRVSHSTDNGDQKLRAYCVWQQKNAAKINLPYRNVQYQYPVAGRSARAFSLPLKSPRKTPEPSWVSFSQCPRASAEDARRQCKIMVRLKTRLLLSFNKQWALLSKVNASNRVYCVIKVAALVPPFLNYTWPSSFDDVNVKSSDGA